MRRSADRPLGVSPATVGDYRELARRRLPRQLFDYLDGGAYEEKTMRANVSDLERVLLRQRVMRDVSTRDQTVEVLGRRLPFPVILGPVGLAGMYAARGELKAARAAEAAGVPFVESTVSICPLEEVARASATPPWFQLYVMRDRDFVGRLIDRAKAARCSALVLTLDLQILGQRHKDLKNGLSTPPKLTLANIANMATKPRWCWAMLQTRRREFGNIVGHVAGIDDMSSLSEWTARQFDPKLSWDDVAWIKDRWGGKLVLKGIMDAEDAHRAVASGADALIVSNHGGRQLDGAPSSIRALPAVVGAVGRDIEVWMDGGIRSGQDVIRALALGAKGTLIGRAFTYGLGAMGEAGVTKALEIIAKELDLTMAFCGLRDIADVDANILWR